MQGDNEERIRINNYLNSLEKNLKGQPIFRLTWASSEFELREGTFNEFKGDLFVRTVYGVKKTPKYPQLRDTWILEQWFPPEKVQTKEIKDHNGYECIYAFRKGFQLLPLRLAVVEILMHAKQKERKSPMLTKSILNDQEIAKEDKMDKFTQESLNDYSVLESNLHSGEAISLAGLEIPKGTKVNA